MTRTKSFNNQYPLLYLVATPIGNLKEISNRALEVLSSMDIIAAEDTRNTHSLLNNYGIQKELFSLREHNEIEASKQLIGKILSGKKVAYVSDAGYPGISDPGAILVKEAIANNIAVSTVCGSSAFINALVASGLKTDHFYFHGFLSPKENEAKQELQQLMDKKETLIFYEAPHRINKTLQTLFDVLKNRQVCLARELTKINEEYIRGCLQELKDIDSETLKGEMVIIVEGNKEEKNIDNNKIIERVNYLNSLGLSKKDAINVTAEEFEVNKNLIKDLILK